MPAFAPIPLGRPIPDLPHAVSCSLPTLREVRGYEEKDPAVVGALATGYPRFVVHPFARRLAAHLGRRPEFAGRTLWLASSSRMAAELAARLGPSASAFEAEGVAGVSHPDSAELAAQAKVFLQNVGGFLSSREAEDRLVRLGLAAEAREELFPGDAEAEVRRHLRRAFPRAEGSRLLLANCGMNAVYAAFRAVAEVQGPRGRTGWIQLGWLYLDTIAILRKLTASPGDYFHVRDVFDRAGLERLLAEHGPRIAGLVTELPTNPLIQTPDAAWLSALCRRHGVRLILDPSVASPFSLDVLPHADVAVSSLTKYAASEGDVIAGVLAVNPDGPDAAELAAGAARHLEPVYPRDLARLAAQIGRAGAVLARIEANTPEVAGFLSAHPKVARVFWALQSDSRANYLKLARTPASVGGMITFTLKTPMEPFYDRLALPKGPSFGMRTTLICPFLYLAHYDLVTTEAGRSELAANGLDPDLLRLCVGAEPAAEIIGALAEALG